MTGAALTTDARLSTAPLALATSLFSGRSVIVSGGGSGIGRAIAWAFGRLGARLVLCGRRQERLDDAVSVLAGAGLTASALATDIRDEAAVARLFDFAGPLDIVVNNAGGQFPQACADFSAKGWRAVVETNLTGTWLMMQAAAQRWIASARPGAIVNIVASNERGMPGIAHSSAARAGVMNLTKTTAVEWAAHGIRVNCVAPGLIATAGLDVYPEQARAGFRNANPQGRLGDPWEVAQAVAYLASDAASYVTGTTLTIDGGGALSGELWTHQPHPYGAAA